MHQLGSTDPSYFPLVDPLEPAGYEGGEGLPGSGALGEQVPWGGRPGGVPTSCWEMTDRGWNSVCTRYSQISLQNIVFGS